MCYFHVPGDVAVEFELQTDYVHKQIDIIICYLLMLDTTCGGCYYRLLDAQVQCGAVQKR